MKAWNDFKSGFFYAFEGLRFLFSHISLIRLALIPWIINLILFLGMIFLLYHYSGDLMHLIVEKPEKWYWLTLYYFFLTLAFLVILIVSTFFLCFIGNLIASPFHEWMAENTKLILFGEQEKPSPAPKMWNELKRIIKTQCKKLFLLFILEITILLLLLIPGIGALLSGTLTLILLAFQFIDFPFGTEHIDFSGQIQNFFKFPLAWLGFGSGISLMLMIPFVNFSVLPAGVVGAALLYHKKMISTS